MTEAVEESAEGANSGESIEGANEPDGTIDSRLMYKSDDEPQPTQNYARRETKENKKSSASREESLDELIQNKDDVSFTRDENGKIVPTYQGRRVYGEGASMPTRFIGKAITESKAREVHDGPDAAHVIVYHRDPETGKVYFAFEKKPANYPISEFVGTLSLYGGSLKIGESPIEGLPRELEEEDPTYRILIKALNETKWKIAEIPRYIDGVPSRTYIWAAEIKDPNEWSKYKSSKSLEGDKAIKSLEEIVLGMNNNDFAFGFGPIVKGFANHISENYGKSYKPLYSFYSNNIFSSMPFHNPN